jgi:RNA polymerase-binding transcription factor DksA
MAKRTKSGKSTAKKSSAKKSAKVLKKKAAKSSTKSVKKKETMSRKKAKKAPVKKSTKKTIAKKTSAPKKIISKKTKIVTKPKAWKTEKAVEQPKIKLEDIKGYSKKDLDHFKQIILEKRDEIIEQLQNLKDQMLDPTTGEYINENSPYSLHMAEQGTDAMEREKTFLYAQRENKFLGYLEDALKRIEAGTYGICIECIEEPQHLCDTCPLVPKARLEAVPHSQLCLPMKQRQEKK